MKSLFNQAIEEYIFTPLDVQFAYSISDNKHPIVLTIAALLSAETMAGHVCLALADVIPEKLFAGRHPELAAEFWQKMGEPSEQELYQTLKQANAVSLSTENKISPLVLSGGYLYFQRMWQYEQYVANFFASTSVDKQNNAQIKSVLNSLFPITDEIDWQKIAAAVAVTSKVSIISGGPGTGKTTTVARILAALIKLEARHHHKIRIELAAPTGKAAARLTESLGEAMKKIPLTDEERAGPARVAAAA